MSNKHLTQPPSEIALARLKTLLESVNNQYQSGNMVLESDIISSYHEALELFFDSLDGSIIGSIMKIYPGAPADPVQFNVFTTSIQKDIEAVYSEIGALDKMTVSSFNSLLSERQQALDISRRVSNKLGDYLLYADPNLGAGFFYGDSFNTSDRIDVGSSLLEGSECFHSTDEGVILLPLNGEPNRPSIKTITINSISNGIPGSNYQIDSFGHDSLETLGDNEPNTWFEYEKVTAKELSTPLVLDLTISLDQISIINHININPINFGSASPVRLVTIETSKDGKEYVSIKDEVPLKDFVSEDDKEEFDLSPASSKYSGQGFFSFLPRKVQYIHLCFHQYTPYAIETVNGTRLRYAIGLRDINILGRKFKEQGSLVSSKFTSSSEIKKISLWVSENPTDSSTLADVSHFVSSDDGATWLPLQPQDRSGSTIPEIVNFNNDASNSVFTSSPVFTLRHKTTMNRNSKAFDGNVTLKQEKISKMDVVNAPAGGSFEVAITETPIKETVRVIMPFMGSFSCPRPNDSSVIGQSPPMNLDFLEFLADTSGLDTRSDGIITGSIKYPLPFKDISNLVDKMRVFYNGSQLQYSAQDSTSINQLNEVSKVYFLNKGGSELQFGYPVYNSDSSEDTQKGFLPNGGKIQVCLDGDNPVLRLTDRGYVLTLSAPSDGFKETTTIVALPDAESYETFSFNIPRGSSSFKPSISSFGDKSTLKANSSFSSNIQKAQGLKPIDLTSARRTPGLSYDGEVKDPQEDQDTQKDKTITSVNFGTGDLGSLPPVFSDDFDNDNFYIEEKKNGVVLTNTTGKQFVNRVRTVAELVNNTYYTFDPYSGIVTLGGPTSNDRDTILVCKKTKSSILSNDLWSYDKNIVTGRIDTRKIILDPRAVYTIKQTVDVSDPEEERSFSLISENESSHSWFNKSIVRGTVKLNGFFASGTQSVEVPFVDGESELSNKKQVQEELMSFVTAGTSLWSYDLKEIYTGKTLSTSESLSFAPLRSTSSATAIVSLFGVSQQKSSLSELLTNGDWHVSSTGTITLRYDSVPNQHLVSYSYISDDIGVDLSGLYSIDYYNGVIHFAVVPLSGTATFEVSCYSAFYNIGKIVSDGDIEKIEPESKKITFTSAFGMQFLKQDQASKSRPQVLKVLYEYYKKSTESLKDLEPYFSPICKDIAFRAVTVDVLEEL